MNLWFFGILDIFIFGLLVFSIIYGYKKGFVEQFISFINHIFGFIFSLLFAQPLANVLKTLSLGTRLKDKLDLYFINKSPQISETIISSDETLKASIDSLGFPKFIDNFLYNSLRDLFSPEAIEETLLTHLSPLVLNIILVIMSFIILFIGTKILFFIIKILVKYFKNIGFIRLLDSVFGLIFSLFKYYIILTFLFAILALFLEIDAVYNAIYPFLEVDMQLSNDKFRLSKYFYEQNLLIKLFKIFF